MNNVFILEGPDGAGKTTKKEELIEIIKNTVPDAKIREFHNGPYDTPDDAEIAFLLQIEYAQSHPDVYVIFDRCYISERIYSTVLREEKIGDKEYHNLDNKMKALNPMLILCLPPFAIAKGNWEKRLNIEVVKDSLHYSKIYEMYSNLSDYTYIEYKIYDYTEHMK